MSERAENYWTTLLITFFPSDEQGEQIPMKDRIAAAGSFEAYQADFEVAFKGIMALFKEVIPELVDPDAKIRVLEGVGTFVVSYERPVIAGGIYAQLQAALSEKFPGYRVDVQRNEIIKTLLNHEEDASAQEQEEIA